MRLVHELPTHALMDKLSCVIVYICILFSSTGIFSKWDVGML